MSSVMPCQNTSKMIAQISLFAMSRSPSQIQCPTQRVESAPVTAHFKQRFLGVLITPQKGSINAPLQTLPGSGKPGCTW